MRDFFFIILISISAFLFREDSIVGNTFFFYRFSIDNGISFDDLRVCEAVAAILSRVCPYRIVSILNYSFIQFSEYPCSCAYEF